MTLVSLTISLSVIGDDGDAVVLPNEKSLFIQQNLITQVSVIENVDNIGLFLNENMAFSVIEGSSKFFFDTQAGISLNHYYGISLGCSFMLGNIKFKDNKDESDGCRFCGVTLYYTPIAHAIFHPSLSVFVGDASLGLKSSKDNEVRFNIIRPNLSLELNILQFLKVSLGVGYKFPFNSTNSNYSKSIKTWDLNLSLLFGSF